MSSSKIMPNSLDNSVFDGVAKEESVQSVLSAVSGGLAQEETAQEIKSAMAMQGTSEEILENIQNDTKSVLFTKTKCKTSTISVSTSGTKTLTISLTGKLFIHNVRLHAGNWNGNANITVKIDGTTYSIASGFSLSSSNSVGYLILDDNDKVVSGKTNENAVSFKCDNSFELSAVITSSSTGTATMKIYYDVLD